MHNPKLPNMQTVLLLTVVMHTWSAHLCISSFRKHANHLPKSYTILYLNESTPHPNMPDISTEE